MTLIFVWKLQHCHIMAKYHPSVPSSLICFSLFLSQKIMKQLVEAAIKMHSEGVFHRDMKSENVLVETGSDVPRVRVIDFGCGCFVKRRPYRCFSGTTSGFCFCSCSSSIGWFWTDDLHSDLLFILCFFVSPSVCLCIIGTTAYAPPEFYIQGAYKAGPTTVWQLGALLYEMLDGYKQFTTSKFLRMRIKFISELRLLKVSQGKTGWCQYSTWGLLLILCKAISFHGPNCSFHPHLCFVLCPLSSQTAKIYWGCVWL